MWLQIGGAEVGTLLEGGALTRKPGLPPNTLGPPSMLCTSQGARRITGMSGKRLTSVGNEFSPPYHLGRYLNDIRKILGILDPLPPFVTHSCNLSLVFVTYWIPPLPPQCGRKFFHLCIYIQR